MTPAPFHPLAPISPSLWVTTSQDVAVLLQTHREAIDQLRDLVKDDVPAGGWDGHWMKYDDIFYLRYILSFGKPKAAVTQVGSST